MTIRAPRRRKGIGRKYGGLNKEKKSGIIMGFRGGVCLRRGGSCQKRGGLVERGAASQDEVHSASDLRSGEGERKG